MDRSATALGGSPVLFMLDVADADATAAALTEAGGSVVFAVRDTEYGYRQGRLRDPFGFQWMVSQGTEELTAEQRQQRLGSDAGT